MGIIWIILKIAIYTYILNVLLRQTYNFIFILWRKPAIWIGVVAFLSAANMLLAFVLSWDPALVSAATLTALLMNLPVPAPKQITDGEFNNLIDTFYTELGIKRGHLKYRVGLATFAIFSIASYALLFSEVCQIDNNKCVPLLQNLLS